MGKRKSLSIEEKEFITRSLGAGENAFVIAKKLDRDKRTIEKFVRNSCNKRRRSDKGKFRIIKPRQLTCLKRAVSLRPLSTSKAIFSEAGIDVQSKTSRCRILRKIATMRKATRKPPLRKIHKEKRVEWAKRYMKLDFRRVVFTDECRASLDGCDGYGHEAGCNMERQALFVCDVNKVVVG